MTYVRAYLNVVEVAFVHPSRNYGAATVPSHLQHGELSAHVSSKTVYRLRLSIAPHETYAGDVGTILAYQTVEFSLVEHCSDVVPEVMTVAARAMAWAVRQVNGERCLLRYFLKDNARVDELKHYEASSPFLRSSGDVPLPGEQQRNCLPS